MKILHYYQEVLASSKVFAHEMNKIYRDSYGIFGVNGILFNHESPRRGETLLLEKLQSYWKNSSWFTRKINSWQPQCIKRLGFCWRLCKGNVDDDAT